MKPKTVIILVSLLLALTVYAIVRHTDLFKPSKSKEHAGEKRLFAADPKGAKQLTIAPADGKELALVRKDGAWRLSKPVDAPADTGIVTSLLNVIKYLRYQRVYEVGDKSVSDSLTSLDHPLYKVTLIDDNDKSYVLLVGEAVPRIGDERTQTYVRPEGDARTFVVAENFVENLRRSPNEYRDKSILHLAKDDVIGVKVEGKQNFQLRKTGENWNLVQPVQAAADATKVGAILDAVTSLSAEEFVDDKIDPAGLGLKKGEESAVIRLTLKAPAPTSASAPASKPASAPASAPAEGKTYEILFGTTKGPSVYARLGDTPGVFKVRSSVLEALPSDVSDLRDRKILKFNVADVDRIEIAAGGISGELRRQGMEWKMVKPYAGPANSQAVQNLLTKAEALTVYRFLEAAARPEVAGIEPPQAKLTMHVTGKGQSVTLLIGSPALSPEETYVKSAAATDIVVVRTSDAAPLKAPIANYWSSDIVKLPFGGEVKAIAIQRSGGAVKLQQTGADLWSMTEPAKASADANAVHRILDPLNLLTASQIVALGGKAPAEYADANGVIHLAVTIATEPPPPPPPAPVSQPASTSAPASAPASGPAAATKPASKPEPASASKPASAASKPASAPTTTSAPASAPAKIEQTIRLAVVKIGEKVYAWVEDQPIVAVGELPGTFFDALTAELRDRSLLSYTSADIDTLRITTGATTVELRRDGANWQCASRYGRIDAQKVQTFLDDLHEVQADRFATAAEAAKSGLEAPATVVEFVSSKGKTTKLTISQLGPEKTKDRFASVTGVQGLAVLPSAIVDKAVKSLKDFEK